MSVSRYWSSMREGTCRRSSTATCSPPTCSARRIKSLLLGVMFILDSTRKNSLPTHPKDRSLVISERAGKRLLNGGDDPNCSR